MTAEVGAVAEVGGFDDELASTLAETGADVVVLVAETGEVTVDVSDTGGEVVDVVAVVVGTGEVALVDADTGGGTDDDTDEGGGDQLEDDTEEVVETGVVAVVVPVPVHGLVGGLVVGELVGAQVEVAVVPAGPAPAEADPTTSSGMAAAGPVTTADAARMRTIGRLSHGLSARPRASVMEPRSRRRSGVGSPLTPRAAW